ncbi:MAG: hypothetical protein IPK72_08495 [Candidatus Eisenbacteria bacterium]|nr:hypothetical protein [Candidatus Eisenbacteria bacterium]MCC7380466.1 hypothetical protein [Deltaproteobacteria bacterium]
MYSDLLVDSKFFRFLTVCDADLAEEARRAGCRHCAGRLHRSNYPRKPRGGPEAIIPDPILRDSFCCDRDGCRRRLTPESLRFLGRRVYLGTAVLLLSVLESGPGRSKARALEATVGVSVRTLRRWRRWWQSIFPRTRFWIAARARFRSPVEEGNLPRSVFDRFGANLDHLPDGIGDPLAADLSTPVVQLLRWLSPLSVASSLWCQFPEGREIDPSFPQRMPDAGTEAAS